MKKNKTITLLSLTLAVMPWALDAETVTLEPAMDNTMFEEADESNGQGSYLFSGRTGSRNGFASRRALLMFDVASVIPAGAVVEEVSLSMRMNRTVSGSFPFNLHRLADSWGEGTSNATGVEGSGTAASTGDVTWRHRFFSTDFWTTPGGDFVSTPSATTSVGSTVTFYIWNAPGMVTDVQDWIDNPTSNHGWILIGPSDTTSAKRFDSREATNSANRPQLTVTYSLPPSEWAGFAIEEDGRSVNTGAWLGIVDIAAAPWVFVYDLDSYIYAPEENVSAEGGWIYAVR